MNKDNECSIKIERLRGLKDDNGNEIIPEIPKYETSGAAGFDLASMANCIVEPHSRVCISTGLKMAIPYGYELQIRPRSGLALKKGITVLNTPGTIDSDYRGLIGVILFNTTDESFEVKIGDRIAQGVVAPVMHASFVEELLDETSRGEGGFGSTGVK